MKKVVIVLLIGLVFLCGCNKEVKTNDEKGANSDIISCDTKDEFMKGSNVVLVDVRSEEEYNEGHLDNAINIPYDYILEGSKESDLIDINTKIIVYCKSGKRSSVAYEQLKKAGYKNVYNLGAMSNCKK